MKKSDWQYLVDSLLFICIIGIVFIGFLLGLFIPKGPYVPESAKYFLGLHRHAWGNMHFYLSIAFSVFIVIHLIFSWKWIKTKANQIFKNSWPTLLTLTLITALAAPFLIWSFWPKYSEVYADIDPGLRNKSAPASLYREAAGQDNEGSLDQGENYVVITGQMTLADMEKSTGISTAVFKEKLGLPKRTKSEETLGRLKKLYGFELLDIRDIITSLMAAPSEASSDQEIRTEDSIPEKMRPEYFTRPVTLADEHQDEDMLTRGRLAEDQSGILITGQMTFKDIEAQTGIPAQAIAAQLGLPAHFPQRDTLGRLRKRYGFTLQDIRETFSILIEKK